MSYCLVLLMTCCSTPQDNNIENIYQEMLVYKLLQTDYDRNVIMNQSLLIHMGVQHDGMTDRSKEQFEM